jgi:hypothetical protein
MKRNMVWLGLPALLLALGLALPGCDISGFGDMFSGDDGGDEDPKTEELFNGTPADWGITGPLSADDLVAYMGRVSGWDGFISSTWAGELYVNDAKVTSGAVIIQPDAAVRILVIRGGTSIAGYFTYSTWGSRDFLDPGADLRYVELFGGTPAGQGITSPILANNLVASLGNVSGWREFKAADGILLVNGSSRITSGAKMIQPNDTVRIVAREADTGTGPGLVELFNGRAPSGEAGQSQTMSANALVTSKTTAPAWADFIAAGGELYVKAYYSDSNIGGPYIRIASGTSVIRRYEDWVRLLAPEALRP